MRKLILFIGILILTIFISVNIYADTSYIIKKGDNPYKIAKKFKVKVQDIIKVNSLRPANLKPGTTIIIPSDTEESLRENKFIQKEDKKPSLDNIERVNYNDDSPYHIVKKGDTLFSLSKKYSISISELKEINNLRSTRLRNGQKLLIKRTEPRNYTVKKGDTIYKIARKFNIDAEELKEINDLETDILKPGQKILLEPEIELDEPKNYEAILTQAHIDEEIKKVSESKELSETSLQDRLILFAKKLLDIPYRFGGNSPMGIDCSAYVKKVYSLIGIDLPRSAREQFHEGTPVDNEDLSIGDLVFFRTYASFPSHVGIYLGNNLFIHASSRGKKVTIDSLETPYYFKRFIGGKRIIEGKTQEEKISSEG